MIISRRDLINPSATLFKSQKSQKNNCNNLYFHLYAFGMSYKSFSYLTSLSNRSPVNPSTTTFGNINLTETMTNLIFAWKFNQKWPQEPLFAL